MKIRNSLRMLELRNLARELKDGGITARDEKRKAIRARDLVEKANGPIGIAGYLFMPMGMAGIALSVGCLEEALKEPLNLITLSMVFVPSLLTAKGFYNLLAGSYARPTAKQYLPSTPDVSLAI